ncbi:hypothetical protein EV128_12594 [Rhizobium azibense]|nr:hypothetical protein EV128_12594 [Rhizobium azibense]
MKQTSLVMLDDLSQALSSGGSHGDFTNERWAVSWRFGERRIEDKVRDRVLKFHSVHVFPKFRNQGFFTEVLAFLDERPTLGGREFDWIYLEQVNFRLAGHLERKLHYSSDFGLVIDCWRRVTGQLEMNL